MTAEFRLLGNVELRISDRPVDVGHARQRCVLAALLIEANRVVSIDQLVNRVWGEQHLPARPTNAVQTYISLLRRVFAAAGDIAIVRQASGYKAVVDEGAIDMHQFRRLVSQASEADDDRAAALFAEALALWHGEPFAGLDTPWINSARAELAMERQAARLDLVDIQLRRGHHRALIAELSARVAEYPLDERVASQYMVALYRSGRQADALAHYGQVRQFLADELGTDPGSPLQRVFQQVLTADPGLAVVKSAPGPVTNQVPRQLPGAVAHFIGRERELTVLTGLADQAEQQTRGAVVITAIGGTAGVGKTALAVQWAHEVTERFPDGQLYVNLRGYDPGQPMSATDALAAFLRALGVSAQDIPADEDERAARYRSLLAGRRMLVVLDNAGSAAQVRPLLPAEPTCLVVVTSRDSLAGLVALNGVRRLNLDLLSLDEAVALLRKLIGVRVDVEPEAAETLAENCCRLPLALRVAAELAAARPDTPLTDLVTELDGQRRLDLLDAAGDPRAAVRAVFSWSYRHLDVQVAQAFRRAALHPGPYLDPWALAALADMTVERTGYALDRLSRASLVQPSGRGGYGMHDLLRAYARELAAAHDGQDEERAALTRLFDHYLQGAEIATSILSPADQHRRVPEPPGPVAPADPAAARTWLDTQLINLVAVVTYAAENGWSHHAVRLGATLFRYLHTSNHFQEALTIHGHACRAAHDLGDRAAEATAQTNLGAVFHAQDRYQQATDCLRRALDLFADTGEQAGQARALNSLGLVLFHQGRYEQAAGHFQQALELFRETGDRVGQAHSLGNLGSIDRRQGRYEQATSHQRQSLALCRELGYRSGEAQALTRLGDVELRRGHYQQATAHFQEALELFRETGNRSGEAQALTRLGDVELGQGEYQQAAGHFQQALELFREIGDRSGETEAISRLGDVELRQGRCQEAIGIQQRAVDLFREIGDQCGETEALNSLGEAFLAAGRPGHARSQHATAFSLARQIGDTYEQARASHGLSRACQAVGDSAQARRHWPLYTDVGAPEADVLRGTDGLADQLLMIHLLENKPSGSIELVVSSGSPLELTMTI